MNIGAIRHEYKDKNGGKELDRYCDTRFGTCCIMCESAKENKSALRKNSIKCGFEFQSTANAGAIARYGNRVTVLRLAASHGASAWPP